MMDKSKLLAIVAIGLIATSLSVIGIRNYLVEVQELEAERVRVETVRKEARLKRIATIAAAVAKAPNNAEKILACRVNGGTPRLTILRGLLKECMIPNDPPEE